LVELKMVHLTFLRGGSHMDCHYDPSDRFAHSDPVARPRFPIDKPVESNSGTAIMPTRGLDDVQKSILRLLQTLEVLSRQLSEGNHVDLNHAGVVIDVLKVNFERVQPAGDWESPGADRATSEMSIRTGLESLWKRCFNQMRESLKRIRLYSDDIHHKVAFVNAAIELMNHLRRQLFVENRLVN